MDDCAKWAAALAGKPIVAFEPIAAGRNSRVFRATAADGAAYAVKQYVASTERNALEIEFSALQFLNARGIGGVPRAIAIDRVRNLAVYDYIHGTSFDDTIALADIDAAVDFALELGELSWTETGWDTRAAEACFTLHDVVENINARLARLMSLQADSPLYRELRGFLETALSPLLGDIVGWGGKYLARNGFSMTSELSTEERILSPSDFGFHNALRRPDNSIVFFDFEFFGWDDPAKLVSDFLLHPAMTLHDDHRKHFVHRLCTELRGGRSLAKRLPVAYSLFAVKWCAILLNEFIPEHLARRRFAGENRDESAILSEQLPKARRMYERIADTYEDFPYGD